MWEHICKYPVWLLSCYTNFRTAVVVVYVVQVIIAFMKACASQCWCTAAIAYARKASLNFFCQFPLPLLAALQPLQKWWCSCLEASCCATSVLLAGGVAPPVMKQHFCGGRSCFSWFCQQEKCRWNRGVICVHAAVSWSMKMGINKLGGMWLDWSDSFFQLIKIFHKYWLSFSSYLLWNCRSCSLAATKGENYFDSTPFPGARDDHLCMTGCQVISCLPKVWDGIAEDGV